MKTKITCCISLLFSTVLCAGTTVIYNPASPTVGPFPTDVLTAPNPSQATGKQINMSLAPCSVNPTLTSCTNAILLDQLDGFSVNPQIIVCFSGPVDVSTLKKGIRIYPVGRFGSSVAINQILWDPTGNCMYAKPDQVLSQQSEYLLEVTNSVLDSHEQSVQPDPQFTACLSGGSAYCSSLAAAISQVPTLTSRTAVVSASLFTTMKATDWVQKAHALVNLPTSPVANLPAGSPSQFSLSSIAAMNWIPDYGVGQSTTPQPFPLNVLSGVDSVAFGLYLSPNFINVSGPFIGTVSVTPTGSAIAPPVGVPGFPSGFVPVSYHVFLPPSRLKPPGGFPVAIFGHGLGDSQFGASTFLASTLANAGIATVTVELLGQGFGTNGVVQVVPKSGPPVFVATPGRGIQFDPTKPIGDADGCVGPGPIGIRDCSKQSAVDMFAMFRTIQATNGLGLGLNPSRIYFIGQSFGAIFGTLFHASEPNLKAAVLNVGGGTAVAAGRLAPIARIISEAYLGSANPVLLNVPPAPSAAYFHDAFNDNYVFRDMAPVINYSSANGGPSVIAVDSALETADWLSMDGDPLAFAFNLQNQILPGIIGKSTLIQFAYGDLEVPNPTNSALIRAAGLQSSSWYFRFDLAARRQPSLLGVTLGGSPFPILPHAYLSNPTIFDSDKAPETSIALATQQQAALYLAIGGIYIPDPNLFLTGPFAGQTLFQIPATLPEQLNFIQIQP